uniref:5'-3' DNA helicase ZGRF1 n=1 Tax=Leptobrachium leishanense TaxID=445787 RepID=A0A8C5M2X6_9ANUR
MACQAFTVLYTHQKTKKSKVWQDGMLKVPPGGGNATLYTDKGQRLENVFVTVSKLNPGDDLESDRYLITVEAEDDCSGTPRGSSEVTPAPPMNRNLPKPVGLRPPMGLKRKFTGFQGPREVSKKPFQELEEAQTPLCLTPAQQYSSLPSHLFTTSPLFAAPCRKLEEATIRLNPDTWMSEAVPRVNQNVSATLPSSNINLVYPKTTLDMTAGTSKAGGITRSIRSAAQILSLLKSQPPVERTETFAKASEQQSTKCNTEDIYPEGSCMKPFQLKSKWDIYLNKTPFFDPVGSTYQSEFLTNSPGDSQCFTTPAGQSNFTKQDEIMNAKDDLYSESAEISLQVGTRFEPDTLSKSNRQVAQNLLNINFSDQPLSTLQSASTSDTVKHFKYFSDPALTNKHDCGVEEKKENRASSSGISAPDIPFGNIPLNNRPQIQQCFIGETAAPEKPKAAFSQESDHQELPVPQAMEDEELPEVSFNLMDSFHFDSSDEDTSEVMKPNPQCSVQLPDRCVKPDKSISERELLSDGVNNEESCKKKGMVYHGLPLLKNNEEDAGGNLGKRARYPVADKICIDRNVCQTDHPQEIFAATSSDLNPHTVCKKNIVCTEYSSSRSSSPTFSTGFDYRDKDCNQVLTILSTNSKSTAENLNASLEDDAFLLPYKEPSESQAHKCKAVFSYSLPDKEESVLELVKDPQPSIPAHKSPQANEGDVNSQEDTLSGDGISLLRTLTKHPTALESLNILQGKCQSTSLEKNCERSHCTQFKEKEVPHRPELTSLAHSVPFQDAPPFNRDDCCSLTPYTDVMPILRTAEIPPSQMGPVPSGEPEDSVLDNVPLIFQDHLINPEEFAKSPQLVHPVEFRGHRVEGSASSAVILRPSSCVLKWGENPDRWSHRGLPIESTNGFPSPGAPTSFTWNDIMQLSSVRAEDEEECFISSEDLQTTMNLNPPPWSFIQSSSAGFRQPQWITDSQESDCDWDLSQWQSTETSKVTTPTQRLSPKVNALSFLRRRNEHIVENKSSPSKFSTIQYVEDADISKSRLQERVPIVSGPDDALCSGIKLKDDAYKTSETSFGNILLCPDTLIFTGDVADIYIDRGRHRNINFETTLVQQSKLAKYENVSHSRLLTDSEDKSENEDFSEQSLFGKVHHAMKDKQNNDVDLESSARRSLLGNNHVCHSRNSTGSQLEQLNKSLANRFPNHVVKKNFDTIENGKVLSSCDLCFPRRESALSVNVPKRELRIPVVFQSAAHYKQVFTASLIEHLNIVMFDLAQRLHKALSKVDMSFYTSPCEGAGQRASSNAPLCLHQQPAKLLMVKKEGPNKGRFFYTCDAPKSDQCKFFKWMEEVKCTNPSRGTSDHKIVMGDMKSLSGYVRGQNIALYEESQLIIRKISGFHRKRFGKFKKTITSDSAFCDESKTKLYLKLSWKGSSSTYSKDDLWVISKTLNFDPMDTFIACSAFFGPSANNDIEILPLKGYYPSNWPANMFVHALLICNASTELTALRNIQEHFNPSTLPLMPHLLKMNSEPAHSAKQSRGRFNPPSITGNVSHKRRLPKADFIFDESLRMITQFGLNEHQASALIQVAQMMMVAADGSPEQKAQPITIIHGVFGAGKSYLLALVVLFLVQIFEYSDQVEEQGLPPWKILISSSTNVAVDRVLLGLLDLKFDRFIRVGSIRKIAKPVLPYSLHSGSDNDSEQMKELLALLKDDLTPIEKAYVRKSIEQQKLGTNKTLLGQVPVVGATCAACPFACLSNLKFPVVILDECSQMTEPASMLPIARFQCEKLILVGDPKQLSPTIQGSEAAHDFGLEQTIFDRLCMMGHRAILLKTQYRCHPAISTVTNELFYDGHLLNGVSEDDRKPLLDWLPTLCFYNANGIEMVEGSNSFHNVEEANFTVKLIQSLIATGIEGSMIGVVTLYKAQMYKICTLLSNTDLCDSSEVKAVQVSTVDAFQGAEKEVIILSCVRTKQVGFIDSEKRMNVALTRGKRHLLIVGSLACLRKNKLWEHVIHHCEKQINGLKHVSQWEEKLNAILTRYQEIKLQDTQAQKMKEKDRLVKTSHEEIAKHTKSL